ncbi:ABC transporter permease [Dyadobacter sp. MSC1_007]|jgi:putative ABC transport system permease protein|uniref:ABC transporter permease n=1 Tax=Dyadobacter sp. MSC1_007 TaxID=2909264 RepID=UPI00203023D0|nr:ABC transporter permease [Dyadobacter sp. MSC1_007]
MLRNYIKIAWRNVLHNRTFSAVNILGLALGMACSLLIFLWIQDETQVDQYHANGPNLYYVMKRDFSDGKVDANSKTPGILPETLKEEFPEISHAVGFTPWDARLVFAAGNKSNKELGHWAGADWFKMFSIPLLAGTAETALSSPAGVAISKKLANTYFGSPATAIGQSIRIENKKDYQVTAVFDDLPDASSEKYDFLLSWEDGFSRHPWMKEWGNSGPQTRILLRPDADVTKLNAKLKPFLRKYNHNLSANLDLQLFLHPFEDAYLYSKFTNGRQDGGRIDYVRLFSIVAVLILVIACINFMNLSTARSVKRAREVGVRKAMGAGRGILIGQFMGEAILLAALSLLVSLVLVWCLTPTFNILTGKHLSLEINQTPFWLLLAGTTLLTGVIAGSYPALYLSSFEPRRVLTGLPKFGSGARVFRQGLVVFQFMLSMVLIVGTIVIYRQINLLLDTDLGYQQENLIYIAAEGKLGTNFNAFKEQAEQLPGVQGVTYMDEAPTGIGSSTTGVQWSGKDPNASIEFAQSGIGYDFNKTLKIKLTGREFSREFGSDSSNYIINESAAKRIGYQDPIGQSLTMWDKPGKIIGVMSDFHFQSLHIPIQPLILRFDPKTDNDKNILISVRAGHTKQTLASLKTLCKQINPQFPFTYQFADEEYTKMYKSETVVRSLAYYFAFLAIFISSLGLFGLATFTAEQRTKEIGVRKVLGASVMSIVELLSKDFLALVMIAIVIGSPLAWYAMNEWLDGFAYKVAIEWWIFALAGALAVGIALLTISLQSLKAAIMNPVNSLRSE